MSPAGPEAVLHLRLPETDGVEVWRALGVRELRERGVRRLDGRPREFTAPVLRLGGVSIADADGLGPADAGRLRPHAGAVLAAALERVGTERARVVLDVRRQDRLMEYAHLHAVRAGGTAPFAQRFPRAEEPVLDWSELADRLAAVPGVAEVVVRPVELFSGPGALAGDLLRLAGILDGSPAPVPPTPTYAERGYWVARAMNAHVCSDGERELVCEFVAENFPGPPAGGNQFLDAPERARILAAYEGANRELYRRRLPDLPEDSYLDDRRTAALGTSGRASAMG